MYSPGIQALPGPWELNSLVKHTVIAIIQQTGKSSLKTLLLQMLLLGTLWLLPQLVSLKLFFAIGPIAIHASVGNNGNYNVIVTVRIHVGLLKFLLQLGIVKCMLHLESLHQCATGILKIQAVVEITGTLLHLAIQRFMLRFGQWQSCISWPQWQSWKN